MAKSRDPGVYNKLFSCFANLPVLNNKVPFLLPIDRASELFFQVLTFSEKLYEVCSVYLGLLQTNLCFKFAEVEKFEGYGIPWCKSG